MTNTHWYSAARNILVLTGTTALLFTSGCGKQAPLPSATSTGNATVNKDGLLLRGKMQEASPPAKAVIGMIYRNTSDGREYIYDGGQWVPHDATVDTFYKSAPSKKTAAAVASLTSLNGGAHDQHAAYGCEDCHRVDWSNGLGLIWFDNANSPAFGAGMPAPVYNAANVTCSNVACHSMPRGLTFSYYFQDGSGEPVLNTVNIISNPTATTPNWYSAGAGCAACHGNPPVSGTSGSNVWHSGRHAPSVAGSNECQFCHPDATGSNMQGITITDSSMHKNGTIDVQVQFTSTCFTCH